MRAIAKLLSPTRFQTSNHRDAHHNLPIVGIDRLDVDCLGCREVPEQVQGNLERPSVSGQQE
jgi:hypothetical protein